MNPSQHVIALVGAIVLASMWVPAPALAQVDRARQFDTRYYRIWTDVEYELARDLCRRMDAMYEEYARRFAAFTDNLPPHERFEVRIFARREDYVRYTRDPSPNSGGIFIPNRRLLAAYLEGQGRDALRRTLQHEAFHQFAHSVIGPNIPLWLNEGLAQVFEEAIWTGNRFLLGQVPPARLRQLQYDLRQRQLIDFRRLLAINHKQWSQAMNDPATTATQYNQTWAMAHFLVFASGSNEQPLYRGRLIDMLVRCRRGIGPDAAFAEAFSDNIAGFQQRFVEYAQRLEPTVEATYLEHQTVLADMLVVTKQRGRSFDSIEAFRNEVHAGRYRMHYSRGRLRWTTAEDPSGYFTDLQGRLMNERQLFFQSRHGAPLPDILCRVLDGLQFHTRFHQVDGKIEHEVLVVSRP